MRNKTKLKTPFSSFFLPLSIVLINYQPSPAFSGAGWMRNVGWSHFITLCLCHSFLLTLFSTLVWGLCYKIEPFINLSHVGPFHRLQLFKNCSGMASSQAMVLARKRDPVCTHQMPQFLQGAGSSMGYSWHVDL